MSKKILNASEMGKKGGNRLKELRGSTYFAEIGAKGRQAIRKKDPDFYKRLSRLGVQARKRRKIEAKQSSVDRFANILIGKR